MTRAKCEDKILELMEEIIEVYHEYDPKGLYLTLCYLDDEPGATEHCIMFDNGGRDRTHGRLVIDYHQSEKHEEEEEEEE